VTLDAITSGKVLGKFVYIEDWSSGNLYQWFSSCNTLILQANPSAEAAANKYSEMAADFYFCADNYAGPEGFEPSIFA
jgi:hypothetical protein